MLSNTATTKAASIFLHVRMMTDILLRRLIEITDKYPLTETDISMIALRFPHCDIGESAFRSDF